MNYLGRKEVGSDMNGNGKYISSNIKHYKKDYYSLQ